MNRIIEYHKCLSIRENSIGEEEKYALIGMVVDETNCPPAIAFEMLELYDVDTVINIIKINNM